MRIETKRYTLDPSVLRRAAYRTYWSLLWPVMTLGLVGVIGFWVVRIHILSLLCLMLAIGTPFAVANRMISRVRKTGGFEETHLFQFEDDGVVDFTPYRSTFARYERYTAFERVKEGIRASRPDIGWMLIPHEAFSSDEDYREVCNHLVRIGKMRQAISDFSDFPV